MSAEDYTSKILSALDSSTSSISVKKLRKQILLQLQTDSDDKVAKKTFKKVVQSLETDGKLKLDSDGMITLIQSKKEKKKKDKEEKNKKKKKKEEKKKRKISDTADDDNKNDNDNAAEDDGGNGNDDEAENDDHNATKKQKTDDEDVQDNDNHDGGSSNINKNAPCPGNPSGYTRLFLGNLPFAVDEASLRTFFSPALMTHVKWITDKETGKFYGSAFIEMSTSKCGAIAVKERNGEKLMGRPIRVNFAPSRDGDVWPPTSKEVTGNGGQAGGSGVKAMSVKPDNCMKLFIGNLSYEIDDDSIVKFFANVEAEVKAVRWLHHKDSGDFKGVGYVEFWNTEACEKAATLNGKTLLSRPIRIDWTD